MPRGSSDRLAARIVYTGPLARPRAEGRRRSARLQVTRGDVQALDVPLYAGEDVGVWAPLHANAPVDGLPSSSARGLVRAASSVSERGDRRSCR